MPADPTTDDLQARADRRLQQALDATGSRDPREFYRERLRELKQARPDAYERAVAHYRDVLVPTVAGGETSPLQAWTAYGRHLAELREPGRTVCVDPTGRARAWSDAVPIDALVLHLPDDGSAPALLVALPVELSPAQRATYDWLVGGRQKRRGA